MAENDNWFQFPIASIRTGKPIQQIEDDPDEKQRLFQQIRGYSIIHFAKGISMSTDRWDDLDRSDFRNCVVDAATKLTLQSDDEFAKVDVAPAELEEWNIAYQAVTAFSGGNTIVRLRKNIFLDFASRANWRDFAVLAAIYGAVGKGEMALVRKTRLLYLAAGFDGQAAAMANLNYCPIGLSNQQVSRTISSLEDRSLFARASINYRDYYYSIRLSREELATKLADMHRDKVAKKVSHREMTKAIREGDTDKLPKSRRRKRRGNASDREEKSYSKNWHQVD